MYIGLLMVLYKFSVLEWSNLHKLNTIQSLVLLFLNKLWLVKNTKRIPKVMLRDVGNLKKRNATILDSGLKDETIKQDLN